MTCATLDLFHRHVGPDRRRGDSLAADIPDRPEKLAYPDLTFDVPDADALRFELTDGTPVYAKQDSQFPLVNITVYFRGGRYLEPEGKAGLAAITGDAWRTGGAGERTAQELDEELDFLAANLGTNIGDVTGSVSLNVLSKDLDAAMALLMDVAHRAALPGGPLRQGQGRPAAGDEAAQRRHRRHRGPGVEPPHLRRRLLDEPPRDQASVDAITAADCKAFVEAPGAFGQLVVAVAGDFTADRDGRPAQHAPSAPCEARSSHCRRSRSPSHDAGNRASTSSTSPTSTRVGCASASSAQARPPGRVRADGRQRHPRRRRLHGPHDEAIRSDEGLAYSAYSRPRHSR